MAEKYLTVADVAELLECDPSTAWRIANEYGVGMSVGVKRPILVITAADVAALRLLRPKRGRPKGQSGLGASDGQLKAS